MEVCKIARNLLDEWDIRIGRVIARPFIGDETTGFKRTANRHDFSILPEETTLNRLQAQGIKTIEIGKISDIFAGLGISESHPTKSNGDGMSTILHLWDTPQEKPVFLFANLVDFDSLYGHRRDPEGYAGCLRELDHWLQTFLCRIEDADAILITADHGNDPYHTGTDHTREQVPLFYRIPTLDHEPHSFADVGRLIESFLTPQPTPTKNHT